MAKRREFSPEYRAKLVIEAPMEEATLSEIAAREGINVKQLGNWKWEFLDNAGRAFSRSRDEKAAFDEVAELKEREREYQANVGQLTLEVDFLIEVHEKLFGTKWDGRISEKK